MKLSSGTTEAPATFWERLEPDVPTGKPTVLMVPGGAHTAACYLATADGRPGWAVDFVRAGYPVLLADWPGTGRSGFVPLDALTGDVVCAGLAQVIRVAADPVVLLTHSMSGAYGWKLLETVGERISRVIAIAPSPPGNIQPDADVVRQTADTIEIRGTTNYVLHRREPFVAAPAFVRNKLVGACSTQFPLPSLDGYGASLIAIPPRLLQERQNVAGSQLRVADTAHFVGKKMLVVTGTEDLDHPRALDEAVATWLAECGAASEFRYLGDAGITGNGHMLMLETNSAEIARLLIGWLGG